MKKLYLIRHAKSDWSNSSLEDFDRPLNKRGKKNIPFMAKILSKKNINPDLILSSPAYRARQTAKSFISELKLHQEIHYNEYLYEARLKTLIEIITFIEDEYDEVMLFGHNPSLNMLGFYLLEFDENIPTCGILEIQFDCKSWREISKSNAKLVSFEYPKKNY